MDPIERFRMLRDDAAWDDENLYVSSHPSARAALGGMGGVGAGGGRARWWVWAVPSLVVVAAMVALAAFSLGGVLTLGHGDGPAGQPGPSGEPAVGACTSSQLDAQTAASWTPTTLTLPPGVAMSSFAGFFAIELDNTGRASCVLPAWPDEVQWSAGGTGGPGGTDPARRHVGGNAAAPLTLQPGDRAYLVVGLVPRVPPGGPLASGPCAAGDSGQSISIDWGGDQALTTQLQATDAPSLSALCSTLAPSAYSIVVWPISTSPNLTASHLGFVSSTPGPNSAADAQPCTADALSISAPSRAVTSALSNYYALVAFENDGDAACALPVSPVTAFGTSDGARRAAMHELGSAGSQNVVLAAGETLYQPVALLSAGASASPGASAGPGPACDTGEVDARVLLLGGGTVDGIAVIAPGECHPSLADLGAVTWPLSHSMDITEAALGVPSLQNPGINFGVGG